MCVCVCVYVYVYAHVYVDVCNTPPVVKPSRQVMPQSLVVTLKVPQTSGHKGHACGAATSGVATGASFVTLLPSFCGETPMYVYIYICIHL